MPDGSVDRTGMQSLSWKDFCGNPDRQPLSGFPILAAVADPERNPYQPPAFALSEDHGDTEAVASLIHDNTRIARMACGSILAHAILRTADDLLRGLTDFGQISRTSWPRSYAPVSFFVTIIFAVSAVVSYFIWLYRTARNAEKLKGARLSFRPGMAVGCYFIPVFNFFAPCRSMLEIVRASFVAHPQESPAHLVVAWWLCLIAMAVLPKVGDMDIGASMIIRGDLALGATVFNHLAFALMIPAAILICLIITRTTAVQSSRHGSQHQ